MNDVIDVIYLHPFPNQKKRDIPSPNHHLQQLDQVTQDPSPTPSYSGGKGKSLRPSVTITPNGNHTAAQSLLDAQQPLVPSSTSFSLDGVAQPSTSTIEKNQFKCDMCDHFFPCKWTLSHHINTHTGKRPYKCTQCSKTFSSSPGLSHHRKIHSPPEFKCDFCPKLFKFRWNRDIHMNIHTGAKTFNCDLCNKRFNSASGLVRHKKSHSTPKYECPFCHKMFSLSSNCKLHWNGRINGYIGCLVRRHQIADKSK